MYSCTGLSRDSQNRQFASCQAQPLLVISVPSRYGKPNPANQPAFGADKIRST